MFIHAEQIAPGMYTIIRVYFRASKLGVHVSQVISTCSN